VTVVGELALWVALFLAVWGSVASFGGASVGRPELAASGVRSIVASAGMTTLAGLGLGAALIGHDFSLQYVASHTTLNTPTLYLVTAFWAGPPGAMLSFALALSLCSAAVVAYGRRANDEHLPWVVGALAAVLALVLLAVCFATNPYDRIEWVPADGKGLDPRLQNALAAPYYLATYGGYAAASVPFALAVGAAMARTIDAGWLATVHRWTLVTWCLLTLSSALRMRWTYLEPVAGGLWQTDPAQLATAGGWILGFALLRSFAVRAGAPTPRSVASLALATFCFALLGAAALPRPPGPPETPFRAPPEALVSLIGFAIVAAGVIHSGVRRVPAASAGVNAGEGRWALATLVVYVGGVILLAGVAATQSWTDGAISVRPGQATELTDPYRRRWRFVSQGVSRDERMNYLSTGVALEAWRDGRGMGIISTDRRQYLDSMQRPIYEPASTPGVWSSLGLDVYVVLAEVRGEAAQLRVGFRPLVASVWIGWLVVAAGGFALGAGLVRPYSTRANGATSAVA
jgi:cytochrome c biogenesis factor